MTPRKIRVAVFEHKREGLRSNGLPYKTHLEAYTMWYSPSWSGCCLHEVEAVNGTAAKKLAKDEHRGRCMCATV